MNLLDSFAFPYSYSLPSPGLCFILSSFASSPSTHYSKFEGHPKFLANLFKPHLLAQFLPFAPNHGETATEFIGKPQVFHELDNDRISANETPLLNFSVVTVLGNLPGLKNSILLLNCSILMRDPEME